MLCKCTSLAAAAVALGLLATPASAAPLSNLAPEASKSTSAVEKANYRRCWWHRGHRHCRWVYSYGYAPSYGYGPGYYGPGFGFYFGGGHRHGWHGHRGGWHGGHRHR